MPYLDKYFDFIDRTLPPPPFNRNIIAGAFAFYGKRPYKHPKFIRNKHGQRIHLYAMGQCYILSPDMARTIFETAAQRDDIPYIKESMMNIEDHDASLFAFSSEKPMQLILLDGPNMFWKHPVKRKDKKIKEWQATWDNEIDRMKQIMEQ